MRLNSKPVFASQETDDDRRVPWENSSNSYISRHLFGTDFTCSSEDVHTFGA